MGPGSCLPLDTELHEAVRFSDICEVRKALNNNHDPNQIGLYQWAPVHEAASNGEVEILQLLLSHNGDANVGDELKERTPLHYAAEEGHLDCVQLLMKAGGDCSIEDSDGHTALQLATAECRNFLETSPVEKLVVRSTSSTAVNHSTRTHPVNEDTLSVGSNSSSISSTPSVNHSTRTHPVNEDTLSVGSNSISISSSYPVNQHSPSRTLGHAELSFEYDSRKKTLRIRVWQVTDIVLPPDNVSMVGSIYVKSFLMPDSSRASKRKTEEIKLNKALSPHPPEKDGASQSVNFKFSRPLEYSGISKEDVEEKTVQIELCVIQKYSRKTFLVSFYKLPFKTAVRKLVRQKYPLIACNNDTIPDSMRLRGVESLQVVANSSIYHSNPNFRSSSTTSLNSRTSGYAASDTALEQISVEVPRMQRSNVVITISAADQNEDVLSEIKSTEGKSGRVQRSKDTSISFQDCNDESLTDICCVKRDYNNSGCNSDSVKLEMTKKCTLPVVNRMTGKSGNYPVSLVEARKRVIGKLESDQSPVSLTKIAQIASVDAMPPTLSGSGSNSSSPSHSRPDTPSWDPSDILPGTVGIDMENIRKMESSDNLTMRSGSCLPLPSSLTIPCRGSSFNTKSTSNSLTNHNDAQSSHVKKGKKPMKKSAFRKESNIHYKSSSMSGNGDLNSILMSRDITPTSLSRDITPTSLSRDITLEVEKETVCIDIDTDDYKLPETVKHFTVPSQVFLSDESD